MKRFVVNNLAEGLPQKFSGLVTPKFSGLVTPKFGGLFGRTLNSISPMSSGGNLSLVSGKLHSCTL
ncbi:MAG: hypothetical protein B6D45_00215 [Ignavibacteriales bacterium UTCHB3]|nr:MAG: hypothetical protein B6D45_00215 [Ignavibacteriales bacterium UTCHB3]